MTVLKLDCHVTNADGVGVVQVLSAIALSILHEARSVTSGTPTKVIAASLALSAFVIATIAGLAVDNPAENILTRAIISMVACHALGLVVGTIAERAVTEAIEKYVGHTQPGESGVGGSTARASSSAG